MGELVLWLARTGLVAVAVLKATSLDASPVRLPGGEGVGVFVALAIASAITLPIAWWERRNVRRQA